MRLRIAYSADMGRYKSSQGAPIKVVSRGFTIVELLVVVVVIAILAAIVTVSFNGILQSAQNSETLANIRQARSAIQMYVQENGKPPLLGVVVNIPELVEGEDTYYPGAVVCLGEGYPGGTCGYEADAFDPREFENVPEEPLLCQQLSVYVNCPFQAMAGADRTVAGVYEGEEWRYKNAVYVYYYDPASPSDWYYAIDYMLRGDVSCGLSGAVKHEDTSFGERMTYCYVEEYGGAAQTEWVFD